MSIIEFAIYVRGTSFLAFLILKSFISRAVLKKYCVSVWDLMIELMVYYKFLHDRPEHASEPPILHTFPGVYFQG
jgi:hypothetical protein